MMKKLNINACLCLPVFVTIRFSDFKDSLAQSTNFKLNITYLNVLGISQFYGTPIYFNRNKEHRIRYN